MKWIVPTSLLTVLLVCSACSEGGEPATTEGDAPAAEATASDAAPTAVVHPDDPSEPRLTNVRQLTFGGQNAEAYWSWDDSRIIFQMRDRRDVVADQIFVMNPDGSGETLVSTGGGKTTCAFFLTGDERIVYASTHHLGEEPPTPPPATPGVYTWPVFDYEIYTAKPDGSDLVRITDNPGYDAEPTVGPDGRIVFTSERDGDIDVYTMDPDGTNVVRLTDTPGYDGGPFFSHDGKLICYRANHPEGEDLVKFRELLASDRVQPTQMDIWVMNSDGSEQRRVTDLRGAQFAPYFHPDGKRLIFASNHEDPRGRNFDLYLIGIDGSGLERVTTSPVFDCFPMFSRDGKQLLFSANRFAEKPHDTNVFVADWVE